MQKMQRAVHFRLQIYLKLKIKDPVSMDTLNSCPIKYFLYTSMLVVEASVDMMHNVSEVLFHLKRLKRIAWP